MANKRKRHIIARAQLSETKQGVLKSKVIDDVTSEMVLDFEITPKRSGNLVSEMIDKQLKITIEVIDE